MSIAMKPPRATVAGAAAAPHPLAGAVMNGADMIVQVLADEGVDTIFGYSGGAIRRPTTPSSATTRAAPARTRSG